MVCRLNRQFVPPYKTIIVLINKCKKINKRKQLVRFYRVIIYKINDIFFTLTKREKKKRENQRHLLQSIGNDRNTRITFVVLLAGVLM